MWTEVDTKKKQEFRTAFMQPGSVFSSTKLTKLILICFIFTKMQEKTCFVYFVNVRSRQAEIIVHSKH